MTKRMIGSWHEEDGLYYPDLDKPLSSISSVTIPTL